jgi:hypothetical protein
VSIALVSVTIRHERRVRLFFDNTLASGAFSSVSYYTVTSVDGSATDPSVVKAFAVASSPTVVELALGGDLVQGAAYSFAAVGVPATDLSVTPGGSAVVAKLATEARPAALGARGAPTELETTIFGVDLIFQGDFQVDPSGDLSTQGGAPVLRRDLQDRLLSEGRPWDRTFGLRPRQYVDGPAGAVQSLRGKAVDQVLQDDRVKSCKASVNTSDPSAPIIRVVPVPVGSQNTQGLEPVQVQVKT